MRLQEFHSVGVKNSLDIQQLIQDLSLIGHYVYWDYPKISSRLLFWEFK